MNHIYTHTYTYDSVTLLYTQNIINQLYFNLSLGREDPLEEGTATHSSIPAGRIPRTEEPSRLQSTNHKDLDMTEHTYFNLKIIH